MTRRSRAIHPIEHADHRLLHGVEHRRRVHFILPLAGYETVDDALQFGDRVMVDAGRREFRMRQPACDAVGEPWHRDLFLARRAGRRARAAQAGSSRSSEN
jgi:hypothetical protein